MTLIRIINGTYGHRPAGSRHPEPKQVGDPPFEVDDPEAERLIALGVAVCADPSDGDLDDNVEDNAAAADGSGVYAKPEYDADMNIAALRTLMKNCGLACPVGMSKADLVAALDAHYDETETSKDVSPPDLCAEGPVT